MIDYVSAYKSQIAFMGSVESDWPRMNAELTVMILLNCN